MKKKREIPVLGPLLKKIAPRIGASVFIEPEWQVVGQITFKSGRHSYFRYNTLDLNPMGGSEIARDKDYSNFFMKSMGYPIVPGSKTFYSDAWAAAIGAPERRIDAAYRHAKKLGLGRSGKVSSPVILKPNSGSQGTGVALVHTKAEFYAAARSIFKSDRVMLVSRPVRGTDYRIVVLDKKIISAYERIPLNVVGDGRSSIGALLRAKQRQFVASSRDTRIRTNDPRMIVKLRHQGLTLRSVPAKGTPIYLLDNANLSTGGDSVDVTEHVHPHFKKLAIDLTRDMGLRLCGVDLMIGGASGKSDADKAVKDPISQKPAVGAHWILEINSAPGLDHYANIGRSQEKIVEDLYLEVLKHMER